MAAKYSDWYFLNGNSVEGVKEQIDEVRALAKAAGRTVKFGLNGFVDPTADRGRSARADQAIIAQADPAIVAAFADR